jgi:putative transcriptional regulator
LRLETRRDAVAFSKEALAQARRNRGLSQTEAAAVLGVPVRTLRSWEQGEFVPSDANQLLLARKYHVELIDLHERREPVPAA